MRQFSHLISHSLIAIMLGRLEMTVEECIASYTELNRTIFSQKSHWFPISIGAQLQSQFDSGKLKSAIEKVIIDKGFDPSEPLDDGADRGCRV